MLFEIYGLPVNKNGERPQSHSVEAAFADIVEIYSNQVSRLMVHLESCTVNNSRAFKCRASAILADWTSVHVDAVDETVEEAMNDAAGQLLKTLWGVFDR